MTEDFDFFATAAKGTEPALRDELREHRFRKVRADRGGVHFQGRIEHGFRACIELRIAVRVMLVVGRFDAPSGDALYEGVRGIDWARWLSPRHSLAVRASCRRSALNHTQFVAQRTKDAIVDQQRDAGGARSDVDLEDPDVAVFVHVAKDRATVHLDLAGEPLHRRKYRPGGGEAPLKETLAAAVVRLSGWDLEAPLVDPMCGTGTLAIEAAMLAYDRAPGLRRRRFGFERWASHDAEHAALVRELRGKARARVRSAGPRIVAYDVDEAALATARRAADNAGVRIHVERRPLSQLERLGERGQILVNPPYGERIPQSGNILRELSVALTRMHGHDAAVLAGDPAIRSAITLRPEHEHPLYNGAIECRLLRYSIP